MVKGETFNLQLFESEAFRHFINVFTNKQSGVTKGCEVTKDTQNITIGAGYFFIQGGLLRETTGTTNQIPSEAGYYKLAYEIDLTKVNTKDEFNQGSYKFIKSLGNYPTLTQQDLDNGGTIYQFEFCQFRITEEGIQDFKDTRNLIDYGVYEKKKLAKEIVLSNDTNTVEITELDINSDKGYEFEIYGTVDASTLYSITAYLNGDRSPEFARVVGNQVYNGENVPVTNASAKGLIISRGYGGIITYTKGTIIFDKNRKYASCLAKSGSPSTYIGDLSSLVSTSADNITSITLVADSKMKQGTIIRIYGKE